MEETSLRTNLAPESLTRSFSVEVPATRKLRAFLHSFLFPRLRPLAEVVAGGYIVEHRFDGTAHSRSIMIRRHA